MVIVLLGLAGGGWWWWNSRASAQPVDGGPQLVPVAVVRGDLVQSVAATGRVVSNLDVEIKCKASGEIIKLPFDVSDVVRRGDLLVELDPVDEVRAVRLAEVAVSQSGAKLEQSKHNVLIAETNLAAARSRADASIRAAAARARDQRMRADRRQDLLAQNLASQEDHDAALTQAVQAEVELRLAEIVREELVAQEKSLEVRRQDVRLAEGALAADQIALSNASQRLADTKVVAPMDGIVSERTVQQGQIISSGITNVGGGTTILTLSDLSQMFILAAVDESDIGQVALGQHVNITVDSYPGARFQGKVVRIATRGVNISNVVTFEVKIEVVSENKTLLKPEMTANVELVAAQKQDVLIIPAQAVSLKDNRLVATVMAGSGQELRPVRIGMSDGMRYEVSEGLREGEMVLVRKDDAASRWRAGSGMSSTMMMGAHGLRGGGGRR
jgi:HlyD family secretion protein